MRLRTSAIALAAAAALALLTWAQAPAAKGVLGGRSFVIVKAQ